MSTSAGDVGELLDYLISDLLLSTSALQKAVRLYTQMRKYRDPKGLAGPAWINTEVAEVQEVMLGREGGWVRNNPEDHDDLSDEKLGEELGDVIFMAIYTGLVNGVNPVAAMLLKMKVKTSNEKTLEE